MSIVTAAESLAILSDALGLGPVAQVFYERAPDKVAPRGWSVRLEDGRILHLGGGLDRGFDTAALGRLLGHPGPVKRSHANRIQVALKFAHRHTQEVRHADQGR